MQRHCAILCKKSATIEYVARLGSCVTSCSSIDVEGSRDSGGGDVVSAVIVFETKSL